MLGDQHAVAVVLHLDADGADAIASALGVSDRGADELIEAAARWREAAEDR